MRRSRRGFTLVELLVVIAIIVILVSILYPVIYGAKRRASQASCIAQEVQLGKALMMYRSDNDGYMPYMALAMTDPATGATRYSRWVQAIMPQVNEDKLFECPDCPVFADPASRPTTQAPLPETSYFYCSYYISGVSESEVQAPSGTIMLMDGWFFRNEGGPGGANYPMFSAPMADGAAMASWINGDAPLNAKILEKLHRHSGAINVTYYDGHTKAIKSARAEDFTPARD
jgi:prepilin-type N-terminal cleavage/methylation domain-containing protein/prepilin-type processing-associated H-X9-DG protein